MSGKKLADDHKAKSRLARHIIGGQKTELNEQYGKACPDCGVMGCKGDCDDEPAKK